MTKSDETGTAATGASQEHDESPRCVVALADPPVRIGADPCADPRRRRRFTAEYKLRILREAESCREPGEIGALLRREGIYSSHLALWRRQREAAAQAELDARKRGPKPRRADDRMRELERENARLHQRLRDLERMLRRAAAILASRRLMNGPAPDEQTDPPTRRHRIA